MSQAAPTTARTEPERVLSRPQAGERIAIAVTAGEIISLDFDPAGAAVAREGDDLVIALPDGALLTLNGYFADAGQLPLLSLPEGSQNLAAAWAEDGVVVAALNRNADSGLDRGEAGEEDLGKLEGLLDGVNRLGALGSLYWGQARVDGLDGADDDHSLLHSMADFLTGAGPQSSGLARDGLGVLSAGPGGTSLFESKPGYLQEGKENREAIAGPENDEQWKVSGSLGQSPVAGQEDASALTSAVGGAEEYALRGFDLEAFVRQNTDLGDWSAREDRFAGLERVISVAGDDLSPQISLDWSVHALAEGEEAVTVALLFKLGSDGELVYVDHTIVSLEGAAASGAGSVSWSVEPGGRYVTSLMLMEDGRGAEAGAALVLAGMEFIHQSPPQWVEPVYEEMPCFSLTAGGNVFGGESGRAGHEHAAAAAEAHAGAAPDADFGAAPQPEVSVARFFLNGEWHETGGESIAWQDDTGVRYEFGMDARGDYWLEAKGPGAEAPSIDHLNIVYEAQGPGGLIDRADLYLRTEDRVFSTDDPDGGLVIGSHGHDVIHGGSGDDVIYGGSGSDVLYGGGGADIFSWQEEDLDGSRDIVKDFSLAENDRLRFEGLLDAPEDLETLMAAGNISVAAVGDTLSLGIAMENGASVNLDVNFQNGELVSYVNDYVQANGSTQGLEQALLQQILFGS